MTRLAAVGDIHGDVKRLVRLLDEAESDTERTIVLLGDYVNLGPDPAGVLEVLSTRKRRLGDRLVLLEGNHDRAFRKFVEGEDISQLLAMGGATTVRSYIGDPHGDVSGLLRASVPRHHVELLRSLEPIWLGDDVIGLHRWPAERIDLGGRFAILGHYYQPNQQPFIDDHVAYLDTGCGSHPSGVLTCFHFPERDWHVY